MDEIDKIRKSDNPSITRDVVVRCAAALLKILEGTVASVPPQGGKAPTSGVYTNRYFKYPVYLWRRI